MRLRDQFSRHSVALVSLVVALTSLAYNTWRNEQTEANRNVRTAGIELLLQLGELDRIVFFSHFERDRVRGNPREGWAIVLLVRDLGTLTPSPAAESTAELLEVWDASWQGLGQDDAAHERIDAAIEAARDDLRNVLRELD